MRAADRELRKRINAEVREQGNTIWREEIASAATSPMDQRIIAKGARIKAGNPAQAIAASSRRPLSDGLIPDQDAAAWEFGSNRRGAVTTYSRAGHRVTRHTKRQLPARPGRGTGRVAYRAWAVTGRRLTSLWTQTIYRAVYDAFRED